MTVGNVALRFNNETGDFELETYYGFDPPPWYYTSMYRTLCCVCTTRGVVWPTNPIEFEAVVGRIEAAVKAASGLRSVKERIEAAVVTLEKDGWNRRAPL